MAGGCAILATPGLARAPRVRAFGWTGRAHAEVGGRSLDLVVETRIEPEQIRVRSTSWVAAEGPKAARTLVVEPEGAWVERGGARQPLPVQQAIHERQQYGFYVVLLAMQQRRRSPPGRLAITEFPFSYVTLQIGADGFPVSADLTIDAPEPGKPQIAEHVELSGRLDDGGVRWPRELRFTQDGKPYFDLVIDRFRVEQA